jgi:hypothetical protein
LSKIENSGLIFKSVDEIMFKWVYFIYLQSLKTYE